MKKRVAITSLLLVCMLIFTACAKTGTKSSDTSSKEDKQKMQEETMKDDSLKDDSMKDDSMKDETMKDDSEKKMAENPAPDFTFMDFDGNNVSLSDFAGKKVYIKFWASWCSVCLSSLPEVDELSAMEKDFEVITVVAPGFSGEKKMEDFKTWFQDKGYSNITVLFDQDGTYMKEFGVRAFPSSAYIDENGGLLKFEVGHNSNENIIKTFE